MFLPTEVAQAKWLKTRSNIAAEEDGSESKANWLTFALLGCAWGIVIILFVIAIAIRYWTKPRTVTYNLSSTPTSFYMLKVKTGAISGGFLTGKYEISLDLLNARLQTLGRVRLPIDPSGKPGNSQTVFVKIGTRDPFDVGAIRVEHNGYRENVSLENIELRELDGTGKVYRADINTKIGFNNQNSRRQTFKTYLDDANIGTAEFLEPGEENLSLLDWVFFLFLAINIILIITLYVPQHVAYIESYSEAAINGCVTAIIALTITIGVVLLYRFFIKKNLPKHSESCYIPQVSFFTVCCLIGKFL